MAYSIAHLKDSVFRTIRDLYRRNEGFALLEGVLLLFIIGFIITSIVVGRVLMERSEVKALCQEIEDLKDRIHNFEVVYDYKPGDFPNASDFWGVTSCGGRVYGANGDGDGLIGYKKFGVRPNKHDDVIESFVAWCHMANANMGPSISVITDLEAEPIAGVNLPRNKLGGVFHITSGAADVFGVSDNVIVVGMPAKDMTRPRALLTPKQALKLDKMMEDTGNPLTGKVRAASGSDAVNECVVDGAYNLKHGNEKLCIMAFVIDGGGDGKDDDDDFLSNDDVDVID